MEKWKTDVDLIEGLSPAIAINQRLPLTIHVNGRYATEIYDYMRVLSVAVENFVLSVETIARQTIQQIVDEILSYPDGTRIVILLHWSRAKRRI